MIDDNGNAKIIDFGSAWIAGIAEAGLGEQSAEMLGTLQYSAPEYLLGEAGDESSDIFSLGVITYQMLTGALPFGPRRIQSGDRKALSKLRYISAQRSNPSVPNWLDATIARAVCPDRTRRYEVVSEFLHDLRFPNPALAPSERRPMLQRQASVKSHLLTALLLLCLLCLLVENRRLSSALEDARVPFDDGALSVKERR
jgi:serine/threonine protein kinase